MKLTDITATVPAAMVWRAASDNGSGFAFRSSLTPTSPTSDTHVEAFRGDAEHMAATGVELFRIV